MPVSVGELLAYLRVDSAGFDAKIASAQGEMRAAAGSADAMEGAVSASSAALTGAGRSAGVASSGTAKFKAAQLSAVAATERYNKVLADSSASTERLASAEASVLRANERVTASTRQQSAALSAAAAANSKAYLETQVAASKAAAASEAASVATVESGSRLGGATASLLRSGRMLLGLGAAFGVFELAKKAIDFTKQANEYHRAMVQVQTTTNTTAAEVTKASGALLKMSGEVATAPLDLATAFYHAKSVGLDYAKSLETVKIAAEGAKVGHADVEETMNALTSTVASGIPGIKNMSSAMGQLIATVGAGDMKLSDLNEALGSGVLTVVKGYGLSITDVGAALATFGDNNIRGADAATMLRMAVQAMAVPAKAGRAELDRLGLSATTLRDDMKTGGLNKAILDLKAHLDAAGVGAKEVGGVLTEVFGKRAGPGTAVLIGQVDRLESKFAVLKDAGTSFGDKWKATTQTASYAIAKLEAKLQSAAITLTAKLGPSIAAAANWLGVALPHAARTLFDIVSPLVHEVGPVLGGAFHVLVDVLKVTVGALAAVGRVLQSHKGLVTTIATAVLAMWAAYKGFAIAVAAVRAVDLALGRLALRMNRAGASMAAMRSGMGGLSAAAVAGGTALAAIGLIIAGVTSAQQEHARQVALDRAAVQEFTAAIEADNGAIGANTRHLVENNLATAGAYQQALKLGISQKTLTDAVMGNADAIAAVHAAQKAYKGDSFELNVALGEQQVLLKDGAQNAKDKAAADATGAAATSKQSAAVREQAKALGTTASAYTQAEAAAKASAAQTAQQTIQYQRLNDAASLLTQTLDKLNGKRISAADARNAFESSLVNLNTGATAGSGPTAAQGASASNAAGRHQIALEALAIAQEKYNAAVKSKNVARETAAHLALDRAQLAVASSARAVDVATSKLAGTAGKGAASIYGMSKASVQLRGDILGQIRNLETLVEADGGWRNSTAKSRAEMASLRQQIIDNAVAHGVDRKAVTRYVTSLLQIPKSIPATQLDVDTRAALSHINSVHDAVNNIPRWIMLKVGVNNDVGKAVHDAVNNIPGHATGGTVPGSGNSDNQLSRLTPGEEVTPKRQAIKYRPLLKAIAADNVHSGGGYSGMNNAPAGSKHIIIQKLEVNQHYPLPDTGKIALPHAMRAAALVLGGI